MSDTKMPVSEIVHQILATVIPVKMMGIMDKLAGDNPVYQTLRPLLVSSLLYSSYRFVQANYESWVKT